MSINSIYQYLWCLLLWSECCLACHAWIAALCVLAAGQHFGAQEVGQRGARHPGIFRMAQHFPARCCWTPRWVSEITRWYSVIRVTRVERTLGTLEYVLSLSTKSSLSSKSMEVKIVVGTVSTRGIFLEILGVRWLFESTKLEILRVRWALSEEYWNQNTCGYGEPIIRVQKTQFWRVKNSRLHRDDNTEWMRFLGKSGGWLRFNIYTRTLVKDGECRVYSLGTLEYPLWLSTKNALSTTNKSMQVKMLVGTMSTKSTNLKKYSWERWALRIQNSENSEYGEYEKIMDLKYSEYGEYWECCCYKTRGYGEY